jgi:hypothetical protein
LFLAITNDYAIGTIALIGADCWHTLQASTGAAMTPQDVRKTMELIDSMPLWNMIPIGEAVELPPDSAWQQWDLAEQLAERNVGAKAPT